MPFGSRLKTVGTLDPAGEIAACTALSPLTGPTRLSPKATIGTSVHRRYPGIDHKASVTFAFVFLPASKRPLDAPAL